MATKTTKATSTTKKPSTVKSTIENIGTVESSEDTLVSVEDTVREVAPVIQKTYLPTEEISCVSVTSGELIMIGRKTGNLYSWSNYGDSAQVEYQDLKAEKFNSKSRYIYDPLFIIDDEELLATPEFKTVLDTYQNILSADDIETLFSLDNVSFRRTLKTLPKGIQNSIKSLAASKIQDGTLDSLQKIRAIDEVLGTDLFNAYLGEE